ncbi:nitroreductase/quinone reductase family protein [Microbacterium halophytorum]|uniref:nitroreductase/quinone reductase family protein n=1 Tax=Microbacterium halophytorum TaxID=2067568 RepID=UPI00131A136F|nr:nitroreductase/quinone reductase family protein [Microbacterium halophytorum]
MSKKPYVPPQFIIRSAWRIHRTYAKGRPGRGLTTPGEKRSWGTLALHTRGRTSSLERTALVAYLLEDDHRFSVLAMNGWMEGPTAWQLNLLAEPRAAITLSDGVRRDVVTHVTTGSERERLWSHWRENEAGLDELAATRETRTEVFVLSLASDVPVSRESEHADQPG